ncbi:MAG: hypothetical protein ACLPX5_03575 [Dissulfurispiraceae bacterium]
MLLRRHDSIKIKSSILLAVDRFEEAKSGKGRLCAEGKQVAIETEIEENKLIISCDLEEPRQKVSGEAL